jgi:small-conductance mechanosensitive channel
MDSIQPILLSLRNAFGWLPDPVIALLIIAVALGVALSLHKTVRKLIRRTLAERYPAAFSMFTRMRNVTQFALLILALSVALPVAPLDPVSATWLARLLLVSVIALIGWAALTALQIGADLYLRRFRLDVEDNLLARKHVTQVRVLLRSADVLVLIITVGAALMTFEPVRQYGVSLFASAGVAGIVAGLAARPVLSNLFAGVQLAMTQPIRLDDAVIVENEWGQVEEITSTYVVLRLWDLRRMIVPLTYFIEKPFQNWTRESSAIIGSVLLYLDYSAPVVDIRKKLFEVLGQCPLWNKQVAHLQVTDAREDTIEVRALVSANSATAAFDLRCQVREKLIDWLQRAHPEALPRRRQEQVSRGNGAAESFRDGGRRKIPAAAGAKAPLQSRERNG